MQEYTLLDLEVVLAVHEEQLAIHGGGVGIRDPGLLESALARPANKLAYEPDADCAAIAAAYAFGLARNHPFIDGNKRTAYVAMETFILLNGRCLAVPDVDALMAMLRLAAGELDEAAFADWIRRHLAAVA